MPFELNRDLLSSGPTAQGSGALPQDSRGKADKEFRYSGEVLPAFRARGLFLGNPEGFFK
jgi:hypothetical protein